MGLKKERRFGTEQIVESVFTKEYYFIIYKGLELFYVTVKIALVLQCVKTDVDDASKLVNCENFRGPRLRAV